jgi:cyclophilin family peptidyl-prolyl cis-trans isomerase
MTNAGATSVRYAQTMTISFNGQGLDEAGVEARIDGPCSDLKRVAGGTATLLQYTCRVDGIGRITSQLIDGTSGLVYGSLKVDVPAPRVTMSVTDGTRSGTIVLELRPDLAPLTVAQFMGYLSDGFYTNTLFHRVRPDTAILGGGFVSDTDGLVSAKLVTRADVPLEQTGLKNVRGAVAMYRETDPGSGNSMFFINTVDNPRFDAGSDENPQGFAVFGEVVTGLEVVDVVAAVPVRPDLSLGVSDVPLTNVRIAFMLQTR